MKIEKQKEQSQNLKGKHFPSAGVLDHINYLSFCRGWNGHAILQLLSRCRYSGAEFHFRSRARPQMEINENEKAVLCRVITTINQSLTVDGMTNKQHQKQIFWFRWSPQGKVNGNYKVAQEIIGLAMHIDIGGNAISYDSRDKNSPSSVNRFFALLIGSRYTLHINPNKMTIEKVEGVDRLFKKLAESNPTAKWFLKTILSKDSCRRQSIELIRFFPFGGVVPESKQWSGKNAWDIAGIGKFARKYRYKYLGKKGKLHHIGIRFDVEYLRPMQIPGKLPFFIIQFATLKGKDCRGQILFDSEKGRLAKMKTEGWVDGELKVKIGKKLKIVGMVQTQTVDVRVSDQNPTKKRPVEKCWNRGVKHRNLNEANFPTSPRLQSFGGQAKLRRCRSLGNFQGPSA